MDNEIETVGTGVWTRSSFGTQTLPWDVFRVSFAGFRDLTPWLVFQSCVEAPEPKSRALPIHCTAQICQGFYGLPIYWAALQAFASSFLHSWMSSLPLRPDLRVRDAASCSSLRTRYGDREVNKTWFHDDTHDGKR